MADGDVGLLNAGGLLVGNNESQINLLCNLSAASAGHSNRSDALLSRRPDCLQTVGGVAAGGQSNQNIARDQERLYLLAKYI